MVTDNHYRWDFIGLSTDNKPSPATSPKVVDGSTFYTSDDSKLYVWCNDQWYEKEGTGGSSINVVQTTGSSTEDVMSQKAVSDALSGISGITDLTKDDYNYPDTDPKTAVKMWTLPSGVYRCAASQAITIRTDSSNNQLLYPGEIFILNSKDPNGRVTGVFDNNGSYILYVTSYNNGSSYKKFQLGVEPGYYTPNAILTGEYVRDDLGSDLYKCALSAKQGKVLNGKIVGTTETFTVATSDWTALADSSPYTYSTTVTLATTLGTAPVVELINDNIINFATYGFGILDITGQVATIASIGQPAASVTFNIKVRNLA